MSRSAVVLMICFERGGISLGQVASHAQLSPSRSSGCRAGCTVGSGRSSVYGYRADQWRQADAADLATQEEVYFPYARMHAENSCGAEKDIREMAMNKLVLDELCYQEARRRHYAASEPNCRRG